jgi:hypothetical protein
MHLFFIVCLFWCFCQGEINDTIVHKDSINPIVIREAVFIYATEKSFRIFASSLPNEPVTITISTAISGEELYQGKDFTIKQHQNHLQLTLLNR